MIAVAGYLELPDGRCIWVPPSGRPFWTHIHPTRDLTDGEVEKYLGRKVTNEKPG